MRKIIVATVLALVLVVSAGVPVFAADFAEVTVTATPAIISISNAPTDWTMNDSTATAGGDDAIRHATTYYSNDAGNLIAPTALGVLDAECRFTVTNDGTVNVDIAIAFANFIGGHAMANSDTGSATADAFGARAYVSGEPTPGPALMVAGTADVITDLPHTASNTKMWGLEVATRTDAFTDPTTMQATVTLTATEV